MVCGLAKMQIVFLGEMPHTGEGQGHCKLCLTAVPLTLAD